MEVNQKNKKIIIVVVSIVMAVVVLVCGILLIRQADSGKTSGLLEVNFTVAGYGEEYIKELCDAFTKETGIQVTYTTDDNVTNSAIARFTSYRKNTVDLYFSMSPCFSIIDSARNVGGYENLFQDLSELYSREVPGKNGATLRDLVRDDLYEANLTFEINGSENKAYTIPWTTSIEGLICNMKVLENYEITQIPRTTDEWEETLDLIKSGMTTTGKVVAPNKRSNGIISANNSAYWNFVWPTWWAQYDGLAAVDKYFAAAPAGATENNYVPDVSALESEGKLVAIEEMSRFIYSGYGYMHPDTQNKDNLQSQVAFLDGEAAFIPSGSWIETETALDFYAENADISFKIIKTPVTSRLADKLGITEEELRKAIDYVDGLTTEAPLYAGKNQAQSDEITQTISNARNIACSGLTAQNKIAIPAYSTEKEEAYQFVLFYASDIAQEILVKYGILSSFGYKADTTQGHHTEFVNSIIDIVDNPNTRLLIMGLRYPMSYKAGLDYTGHSVFTSATRGFEKLLYDGASAIDVYNQDIGYYTREWSRMLVKAGYGRQ